MSETWDYNVLMEHAKTSAITVFFCEHMNLKHASKVVTYIHTSRFLLCILSEKLPWKIVLHHFKFSYVSGRAGELVRNGGCLVVLVGEAARRYKLASFSSTISRR